MTKNLCKRVLSLGGSLHPLIIDGNMTGGTGLMNPSVFNNDGQLLVNIRKINYTLLHSEGDQRFIHRYGPLIYANPENDLHLKTTNYLCSLDDRLQITDVALIDTSQCDSPTPLWDFHGLEDVRIVKWHGNLYGCGVRRDTTTNGEGRIEMSYLHVNTPKEVVEMGRTRIEPPIPSYCEKNWMPVLDIPYHFVKWSNPTQVVECDVIKAKKDINRPHPLSNVLICKSKDSFLALDTIPGMPDFRGGSQVIPWGDYRIACVHQVHLFNNILGQKDGIYNHRFLVWDKNWNLVFISDPFSFLTARIEFCCGMCFYNGDLILSFGFQDNAAFLLRIPENAINSIIGFAPFSTSSKKTFEWGILKGKPQLLYDIKKEVFEEDCYQKFFPVKEGDIVVDVGASVGIFAEKIKHTPFSKMYCLEPNKEAFMSLVKNTQDSRIILINAGVCQTDGPCVLDRVLDVDSPSGWGEKQVGGIKFTTFLQDWDISHINFLKCDCEGGEYDIFTEGNKDWIVSNVDKIAVEFHLLDDSQKQKFKAFRDSYLKDHNFKLFKILSYDGHDFADLLWTEKFIETTQYFMIYIDNTK